MNRLKKLLKEGELSLTDLKGGIQFIPAQSKSFILFDGRVYKRGSSFDWVEIRVRDMIPELLIDQDSELANVVRDRGGWYGKTPMTQRAFISALKAVPYMRTKVLGV